MAEIENRTNPIVVPVQIDTTKLEATKKLLEEIKILAQEVKDIIC